MPELYTRQPLTLVLTFLACFAVSACEAPGDTGFEEKYHYGFRQNARLVADTTSEPFSEDSTRKLLHISIEPGSKVAFRYRFESIAPPNVADGYFSETVYFQHDTGSDSFRLEGEELSQASAFYTRSCFCPIIGALEITEGFIEGEKLSENLWFITADVTAVHNGQAKTVSFRHAFYEGIKE